MIIIDFKDTENWRLPAYPCFKFEASWQSLGQGSVPKRLAQRGLSYLNHCEALISSFHFLTCPCCPFKIPSSIAFQLLLVNELFL